MDKLSGFLNIKWNYGTTNTIVGWTYLFTWQDFGVLAHLTSKYRRCKAPKLDPVSPIVDDQSFLENYSDGWEALMALLRGYYD